MDDLQGEDLRAAYWYNTHQSQVRTAGYGVAIGLVSILWLINLILAVKFLLLQRTTNQALNDFGATQVIYDSVQAPRDLTVDRIDAVSHTADTVGAYAILTNPNSHHAGQFSYSLTVNGINYTFNDGLVMPNTATYIVAPDLSGNELSSADIAITEVDWERVRGPEIVTEFIVSDLLVERSNLAAVADSSITTEDSNLNSNTNSDFARPDEVATEDTISSPTGASITQVSGILTNASAYGFRRVVVTAILKNPAGLILGVQQKVFTDVASFSDYELTFNWQRQFDFNAIAEVVVETDTWHASNLILPGQD